MNNIPEKPYWDDVDLDPGIRKAVEAIAGIPNVITLSSCEGHINKHNKHVFRSHILFLYKDGHTFPEFAFEILKYVRDRIDKFGICLGCIGFKLAGDYYFDCAHDLKLYWSFEIKPRNDYKRSIRSDTDIIWSLIVEKASELTNKQKT